MTRWTVRKELTMFWDEDDEWRYDHLWHVTSPTGVSWGNYATHAEALAAADRMAHTVTVQLPRQPLPLTLPGSEEDSPVVVTQDPEIEYVFLTDEYDGEVVPLYRRDARTLALALLALAEQENTE